MIVRGQRFAACRDQRLIDEVCFKAAVALAVGCWEGYIEAAVREFVPKVRVQAHRNIWTLIAQFELMVDKRVSALNTPSSDNTRTMLIEVTGMDPYVGWIWSPKYSNQTETKAFFDGVVSVRHAFAHGFDVPAGVPGLAVAGVLDAAYVDDAIQCLHFFATKTDDLLEHELMYRHSCRSGSS